MPWPCVYSYCTGACFDQLWSKTAIFSLGAKSILKHIAELR